MNNATIKAEMEDLRNRIKKADKEVADLRLEKQQKEDKQTETFERIREEVRKELKKKRDERCAAVTGASGGVVPSLMVFVVIILLLHVEQICPYC